MISDYLRSYNSLDDINTNKNVLEESSSEYWHLNSHVYNPYAWQESIFEDPEIDSIIALGKALKLERGNAHDPNVLDYRRSFVSWIPMNPANSWIYGRITETVNSINNNYFKFDLDKIERLQFSFYDSKESGCYEKHVDPLGWIIPHNRKLSIVIQLSDPSEYEGGELVLHTQKEPLKIERKKGLATFFPSYTLHECTPVTKGERYSLVAWVHGPPFK